MSKVTSRYIFLQKFVFILAIKLKEQIKWDFYHGKGVTGNARRLNKTRVLTKINVTIHLRLNIFKFSIFFPQKLNENMKIKKE